MASFHGSGAITINGQFNKIDGNGNNILYWHTSSHYFNSSNASSNHNMTSPHNDPRKFRDGSSHSRGIDARRTPSTLARMLIDLPADQAGNQVPPLEGSDVRNTPRNSDEIHECDFHASYSNLARAPLTKKPANFLDQSIDQAEAPLPEGSEVRNTHGSSDEIYQSDDADSCSSHFQGVRYPSPPPSVSLCSSNMEQPIFPGQSTAAHQDSIHDLNRLQAEQTWTSGCNSLPSSSGGPKSRTIHESVTNHNDTSAFSDNSDCSSHRGTGRDSASGQAGHGRRWRS